MQHFCWIWEYFQWNKQYYCFGSFVYCKILLAMMYFVITYGVCSTRKLIVISETCMLFFFFFFHFKNCQCLRCFFFRIASGERVKFWIKSGVLNLVRSRGGTCIYTMIPWKTSMIILNFNSTCFEHTSDDCFFFYKGKNSVLFRTESYR